jgi:deazaflavin-dependent oxidoreductase (nitroreductase family)
MSTSNPSAASQTSPWLPPRWFIRTAWKIHRGLYRVTGGRFGLRQPRSDQYGLAQLTVTGRKSGVERSVMIGYFRDGDEFVTMAMNGWGAAEPAWWLNLQAKPQASLTLDDITVDVTGRAALDDDRDRLWERWRHFDKGLDGYASRRPNETAVVLLSPVRAS